MAGLEVDETVAAAPPFSGVVVAQVLDVAPIPTPTSLPSAASMPARWRADDRLGAPNVAAGIRVPARWSGRASRRLRHRAGEDARRALEEPSRASSACRKITKACWCCRPMRPVGSEPATYLLLDERKFTISS